MRPQLWLSVTLLSLASGAHAQQGETQVGDAEQTPAPSPAAGDQIDREGIASEPDSNPPGTEEPGADAQPDATVQPTAEDAPTSDQHDPSADLANDPTSPSTLDGSETPVSEQVDDDEGLLSEAELHELGIGISDGEVTVEHPIRIYGFMDVGVVAPFSELSKALWGRNASFYMGNLNLYVSKQITDSIRTLAEIRVLLLPNGGNNAMMERVSTAVQDYSDYNRDVTWGGVEVERAYVDWMAHRLLTVRLGIFLTPYGIWNVDHGSPTIIPAQRPFAIGNGYFPERQTGAELFGQYELSRYETFGYHLTLSNGEGPISAYKDLDQNKAVGGRLFVESRRLGLLRLGASGYHGRATNSTLPFLSSTPVFVSQHDDTAVALDLKFELEGLLFQTEWVRRERLYTDEGRVALTTLGAPFLPADTIDWAAYGLVGYRLPLWGIMPYVLLQATRGVGGRYPVLDLNGIQAGLNIRAVDEFVVKLEYHHVHNPTGIPGIVDSSNRIAFAQVAWAF